MDLQADLPKRLALITENLSRAKRLVPQAKAEIEYRLTLLQSLLSNYHTASEKHPLAEDPFLTAQIMFELDRCECLLAEDVPLSAQEPITIPSLWVTVLRRMIAVLLYLKGRWRGVPAFYDSPMLIEMLYLRSPDWLLPITSRLLPATRRRWQTCKVRQKTVLLADPED